MAATLSLTEANILKTLGNFLVSILPAGMPVFEAQLNRVSEPAASNYVSMTPMFQERLATNIDTLIQALFTGSIAAKVLTITHVFDGILVAGSSLFGANVTTGTVVLSQISGTPGGIGTYSVNISQTANSASVQAGTKTAQQYTMVTMQLDIHGPASADNTQIISTMFRDEYAANFFEQSGYDIAPLYVGEPKQIPFQNAEQQYEFRWVLEVVMEANPIVTVPLQFAVALGPVVSHDVI